MSRIFFVITSILFLTEVARAQQNVGSSCRLPHNGENGECTRSNLCPAALQLYFRGLQIHTCSQRNGVFVLCCPIEGYRQQPFQPQPAPVPPQRQSATENSPQIVRTTTTSSTSRPVAPRISTRSPRVLRPVSSTQAPPSKLTRISEQKCKEFKSIGVEELSAGSLGMGQTVLNFNIDNCDSAGGLISGGKLADQNEFPHMAAIGWILKGGNVEFKCGGSLVSERFVLTVAHCSRHPDTNLPPSFVRLGQNNLSRSTGVDISIESFTNHESYNSMSHYFDIALIKLSRDVSFTDAIRPACLWQTLTLPHSSAMATGWGALKTFGTTSDALMKVELNIKPNSACSRQFEDNHKLSNGMTSDFICAGSRRRKDTCEGDSGGPLQVVTPDSKCQFHIIGVTSFGPLVCGARNAVAGYTRVSEYLDWIENIVWR